MEDLVFLNGGVAERIAPAVRSLTINGCDIRDFEIAFRPDEGILPMAAKELRSYIEKTTGADLPIVKESASPRILIDGTLGTEPDSEFRVFNDEQGLVIAGDARRGAMYAVFHFLEKFLGWRFFTADCEACYAADAIDLSNLDYTYTHQYKIRDIYSRAYSDPMISLKRYQNSQGTRGWMENYGGCVSYAPNGIHTFWLLNEDPHEIDQPCLNDPEVQQRFIKNIRKFLDNNWDKMEIKSVHVSQNDNWRYCTCPACKADLERYGTPAGSIIKLCNMIAEDLQTYKDGKYKDVFVITFAYQYSLDCPSNIVCHDQVMVEFAIIDICYHHSLCDPNCKGCMEKFPWGDLVTRSNPEVTEEMRKWAKICKHFYLYDYGSDFQFYYSIYHNFDALYENYRFINSIGAWGYVYLCNVTGADAEFGVLRNYLFAKVTEEPEMTKEQYYRYMDEYLLAYYGNALPLVREYYDFGKRLTDEHNTCFGTYSSPEQMFGPHAFAPYNEWLQDLFRRAIETPGLTDAQRLHVRWLRTSAEYLRLGAIHKAEMESGDPERQRIQLEAIKDFHSSIIELDQGWVDESNPLPKDVDLTANVRTWINHLNRQGYTE